MVTEKSGIRILVVDNQPRTRQSLRALLAVWSKASEIREAATGRQALRLIEEQPPDLVLTDVRMPEMDGLAVTQAVKSRWPSIKVVVMSMYPEYQDGAMLAGADAFLAKGETPEHLLDLLARLMPNEPAQADRL